MKRVKPGSSRTCRGRRSAAASRPRRACRRASAGTAGTPARVTVIASVLNED
jgi:hypothetical protein